MIIITLNEHLVVAIIFILLLPCSKRLTADTVTVAYSTGLLFENRPAVYFCNYKENKKNNIRMLDTLPIEDFLDSMEEYFNF